MASFGVLALFAYAPSLLAQNYFHRQWVEAEGVPVYDGYAVEDLRTIALKPWKRLGVDGAYVLLRGFEGLDNAFVCEIAAGKRTSPERHLFEEYVYVLAGQGHTVFWQQGGAKQTVHWQKGSLLAVPINSWHEHVSTGAIPARLLSVTGAPPILDLFRNPDFVFNNPFVFKDRYNGEEDYFTRGQSGGAFFPENIQGFDTLKINFIRDVTDVQTKLWDDKKGNYVFISMAGNILSPHVSKWGVGTYQAAHSHGPGAAVLIVKGRGYALMWPKSVGLHPFTDGHADKVVRIEWHEGTLMTPPDDWFHQFFNTGDTEAIYLAITASGALYSAEVLRGYKGQNSILPIERGGTLISAALEDPQIKKIYDEELKKAGIHVPGKSQP